MDDKQRQSIQAELDALGAGSDDESFARPLWAPAIAACIGAGLSFEAASGVCGIPELDDATRAEIEREIADHHQPLVKQQAAAIAAFQTTILTLTSLRILQSINKIPPTVLAATLTAVAKARIALQSDASSFTPITINVIKAELAKAMAA